ncbi:MAG: hypothetical protein CMH13_11230 [Martelella sp.]|uniref:hypothetical protein n=1 Tax=Martelella sp. TaxID=1969699 RepID=UPI000C60642B|nr:hypothetical protein [Martelella sp.]MAU21092.1 hypothetical protein [Martelella sp.]
MAFNKYRLTSAGKSVEISAGLFSSLQFYATENTVAEVTAAGYFNEGRKSLYKNMLILADCDIDGTPAVALLRVINVPDSGNVTVAIQDLTAAP